MPLPTFRRRTADEPLPPQGEPSSPFPYSAHPVTSFALTPRKSLQSLVGSVRKRGAPPALMRAGGGTHVGATNSKGVTPALRQSIIEQTHYSSHDGLTNDRAAFRTPSPHPAKASASSSKAKNSPRTFLETLADAIRAPASLFYKEKRQKSEKSGPPAASELGTTTKVEKEVHGNDNSESPTKSLHSKKSFRFKRADSIIKSEQRSSPIDIPKPPPRLPLMHLETTPLLECFGRPMTDPIPTGRPRTPPVLQSTLTFRQAMAEVQESYAKDGIPNFSPLGSTVSEDATLPAKGVSLEDPFRDSMANSELFVQRIQQDSDKVPSSPPGVSPTANPEEEPTDSKEIQDLPPTSSNDTRLATASPYSPFERNTRKSYTSPPVEQMNNNPLAPVPDMQIMTSKKDPEDSLDSFSVQHYCSGPEDAGEKPACPQASTIQSRQTNKNWLAKPTLEDIRGRFRHPERYVAPSSEQMDPFSDENAFATDTITPYPDTIAGMGSIQLPNSALDQRGETYLPGTRKDLRSTSEGNPIFSDSFIRNPPWSSELALRYEKSSSAEELNESVPSRFQGRLSSVAGTENDREAAVGLPLEQTEDSVGYLFGGVETARQPLPGRSVSRDLHTPSPSMIPLPLSRHAPPSNSMDLGTAECGRWPSEDDSYSNDFLRPLAQDHRTGSSNSSSEKDGHSPFDSAKLLLLDPNERSFSLKSESDVKGFVDDYDASEKTPRMTTGEQLAKATAILERFESSKGFGSDKSDNSSTEKISVVVPVCPFDAPRSVVAEPCHSLGGDETDPAESPKRICTTTGTSSNGTTLYSGKSRKSVSTDTTVGMEEDEAMCKGLI